MASNKDSKVRLLIEAQDLSTAVFKDVEKAIGGISAAIDKQSAAALKGEASISDLAENMKNLRDAGAALAKQEKLVTQFKALQDTSAGLSEKLKAAKAALGDYQVSLHGVETLTGQQTRQLKDYENAITRIEAAQVKQSGILDAQRVKMEAAGLDVANLDQQYRAILVSAEGVGRGLTALNAAQTTNGRVMRENAAAAKEQRTAQVALNDALAGLGPSTRNLMKQKAAEAAAALQAERTAAVELNEALATAVAPAKYLLQQRKIAEQTAAATLAFQKAGQQAVETSRSYNLLGDAAGRLSGPGSGAAMAIRGILDPAAQERTTVAGLVKQVEQFRAAVDSIQGPVVGYETTLKQLAAAQSAISSKATLIDGFRNQVEAVRLARAEFSQARAELRRLGAAQAAAAVPSEEMAAATKRAQVAANAAAAAFQAEYQKAQLLREGLKNAGLATSNLTATQKSLEAAARSTISTTAALEAGFQKYGRSTAGKGLFGLSPYALQNLSFQINDVVTSLASGIKPTQVLAQQGGQILQVFPGAFSAILSVLPKVIAGIGVAVVVFGSLSKAIDEVATKRTFAAFLKTNADGLQYQADTLTAIQRDLVHYGVGFADATKLIKDSIDQGFRQDKIAAFGKTVKDFADIREMKVTDAFKTLATAFNGGFKSLQDFNKEFNVFDTAQLKAIKDAYDAGDSLRAQQIAFDAITAKYHDAAENARGPWSNAWRDLKNVISDVFTWLSKTWPIQALIGLFDALARSISLVSRALSAMTGVNLTPLQVAQDKLAAATFNVQSVKDRQASGAYGNLTPTPADQQALAAAIALMHDAQKKVDDLTAAEKAHTAATKEGTAATGLKGVSTARQIELDKAAIQSAKDAVGLQQTQTAEVRLETAARIARNKALAEGASGRAANTAADIARAAEQAKIDKENKSANDRRLSQETSLANQISSLIAAASRKDVQTLATRLAGIDEQYQKIFRSIDAFRRNGGTQVNGVPLDQLKQQVLAQEEILKQQESMKFYEEQIAAKRKESANAIQSVLDDQKAGLISGQDAIQRVTDISKKLAPSIKESATAALAMAEGFRTATPNPRLEAFIAQMQRLQGAAPAGGAPAGAATTSPFDTAAATRSIKIAEDKVKELIAARDEAAKTNQGLADSGTISQGTANSRSAALFADAAPQIQAAADAYKDVSQSAKEAGAITDAVWQQNTAKAQRYAAEVTYVSDAHKKAEASFERAFGSAAATMFESLATSLGNLVAGTESLNDFLRDASRAVLQFGADFLKAIAMAIIQEQALIIAKSISKALSFHAGGVVGGGAGQQSIGGVSPMAFLAAPRYHDGSRGPLGLKSDEMPAILQKGEEVLSKTDPRNVLNGGGQKGGGGGNLSIRNVLAVDPNFIQGQLQSRQGERALFTFLKTNAAGVKSLLGVRG